MISMMDDYSGRTLACKHQTAIEDRCLLLTIYAQNIFILSRTGCPFWKSHLPISSLLLRGKIDINHWGTEYYFNLSKKVRSFSLEIGSPLSFIFTIIVLFSLYKSIIYTFSFPSSMSWWHNSIAFFIKLRNKQDIITTAIKYITSALC